jgi:hypothetical protein
MTGQFLFGLNKLFFRYSGYHNDLLFNFKPSLQNGCINLKMCNMKKTLLSLLALIVMVSAFSQSYKSVVPKQLQTLSVPASVAIANDNSPVLGPSIVSTTRSTSASSVVIGATRYDLQTNGSCQNRLFLFNDDGTIGATWTRGTTETAFAERGTGYNYSDGTAWGPSPTSRVESVRTGWPSYSPWNGGGEIVISHQAAGGLVMNTRPVKGTGSWTQSIVPCPSGATAMTWPRMITNGPNHNTIHIFAVTLPVANGGTAYNGLDGALLYYRSQDGGATWDKNAVQLDPMTSSNYTGFTGDDYAWGTPHGDTIYFQVGGSWIDTFIMESFDNGETWTKIDILSNGHKMDATTTFSYPFYENDGSNAVEMDANGVLHSVFGRMCIFSDGTGRFYRPYTDGLIYWNSTMPMLQDSLNLDTLYNHGQLLGYVYNNANGDPLVRIPYYGVSMSSYPQITIDNWGHMFAMWSGITVGNPYVGNDSLNYRHVWERHSFDHGVTWSDSNDLNKGLAYIYKEFVFPSMDKNKTDEFVRYIYQSADVPGSALKDATNVAYHDNTIEYRKEEFLFVGVNDNKETALNIVSQNSPNPFHGTTTVGVNVLKSGTLSLDVYNMMGQKIMTYNKGVVNAGTHQFVIDGSQLTAGVYFYTVRMNNQSSTHKMIVE